MTQQASARRRGRPRSAARTSDLDPREEILRHAADLFSARGLGATRVSDIAASVDVSPGAIYYHFDNLDAIAEQLLTYVVEESAAFATAAARGDGSSAARLRSLVAQHVERLTSGPYDLWFVAGLSDADGERFPVVGRHASRWRRAVTTLVGEGVAAGELPEIDADLAVALVSGLVYGALEVRHRGGAVDGSEIADRALAALGF